MKSFSPTFDARKLPVNENAIIEVTNQQSRDGVDERRLCDGIRAVLAGEGIERANVSVAILDDPTIHELNNRHLKHDEPTDVLSFVLEQGPGFVEGEIIVSADTAASAAERFGWQLNDELLLYAIHGALHLAGYDDLKPTDKARMREKEQFYLAQFGLRPRYEETQP
jgi:probable rRNA maturation factor